MLNAKLHRREAEIIAEAGSSGNVVIATNMAGRGTDIKIDEKQGQQEDYLSLEQSIMKPSVLTIS